MNACTKNVNKSKNVDFGNNGRWKMDFNSDDIDVIYNNVHIIIILVFHYFELFKKKLLSNYYMQF